MNNLNVAVKHMISLSGDTYNKNRLDLDNEPQIGIDV
jgi:hypothetical protein